MLGLYLHIPFCSAICNYCNFNRSLFDGALKTRYVEALLTEIARAGSAGRSKADTVYFGGGTPSLLEPEEVHAIMGACAASFDLTPDCEVTLEANPDTVTAERLRAYRRAGVNRISFGVQSFREDELRRLSRLHGVERAKAAYAEARSAGYDNVSLDLMMWLPGQIVDEWLESVDQAIDLAPDHLSLYMLEVYPNAPLKEDMARAAWSQAPDDDVAVMYVAAMERLEAAGYEQYEISNVARPGRRSRHNLKYWTDAEWYGFGCGAHTTLGGARWKNVSATADYIERITRALPAAVDVHHQTDAERLGDALFTGLRLSDGIDVDAVNARYQVDIWQRYGPELQPFIDEGLLERFGGNRFRLTRRGMLLAHEVLTVFV
jgi:oxygen-independent coproporphyrinogen-3 oxidase